MTKKTSIFSVFLSVLLFFLPSILIWGAEIAEDSVNFHTRLDAQINPIDLKVNIKDAENIANLWIEKVFGKVLLLGTDTYYSPDGTINAYACEFYSEDSHSSITAITSAWRDDVPVIMMWKGRPFNKEREFSSAIEKKVSDELGLRLSKPNKFYWIDIYDFWAEYPEVNPINNQPIIYNYFQNRFCSKEELDKLWTNRLGWLQLMKKACELDFTLPEDEQISSPEYLRLAQLNLGAKYIEAQWQEADYVLAFLKDKKAIHANAIDLSPKYSFSKYINNVPNIYQGGPKDCGVVASMDVLLYWSKKGYSRLADINHLGALRSALRQAMGWKQGQGLFLWEVEAGIEKYCNDPEYGKLYSFNAKKDIPKNWNNVKSSLNKDNPAILLTSAYTDDPNNPTDLKYGTHYMCIVGYYEGSLSNNPGFKNHKSKKWLIVHDNVDFTKKSQANPYYIDDEPYIDWGRWATNQDLSIVPGLANTVKPSIISLKINNGDEKTDSVSVTLNNSCSGKPIYYIASESPTFDGAQWKKYSSSPGFRLSGKNGNKTIYFMVKSLSGESNRKSDSIVLEEGGTPDEDEGYIYGFNESSGSTINERNGNGINGTIYNGAQRISSPVKDNDGSSGYALQFNGTNQYARLSSHPIISAPFTVMFWANKSGPGSGSVFIQLVRANSPGSAGGYCLYWFNDNRISAVVCTASSNVWVEKTNPNLNTWTHITLTYDQSTVKLYIDANVVAQQSLSGSLNAPNWPLSIGGQGGGMDEAYFNGILDGLKFKRRALGASEIRTIYDREKPN